MPRSVDAEKWARYLQLRGSCSVRRAAMEAGISTATAYRFERGDPNSSGKHLREAKEAAVLGDPRPVHRLGGNAKRALSDFGYFRRRYMGRVASPWQERAAWQILEALESPEKEYLVVNCPPGSGKSTLFTHDIPAWLIARNRGIRIMIGSRTERQARQYVRRLQRTLESPYPLLADTEMKAKGEAYDAEATMMHDFGRFKPIQNELWRAEAFVVEQLEKRRIENKEATVSGYGMDSGFLGNRCDFIIWDDPVDRTTYTTVDAREQQKQWWDKEAESRLEPGGLLVLQGQRMHADDLYRYALDKRGIHEDDEDGKDPDFERPRKYRHIIYKAHYDELCDPKHHKRTSKPYNPVDPASGGCLLDPVRLMWRDLRPLMLDRVEDFQVIYQQEDVDPENVLVRKEWINGGRTHEGDHPGCWDMNRDFNELPRGLTGELFSVATADPSPTKWWGIQWWIYHPDSEQRFLMNMVRAKLSPGEFLEWDYNESQFSGLMEEWRQVSTAIGHPITHWVVEKNDGNRFILAYDHVRRWQTKYGVNIIGHTTHMNKNSADYGVQTIASHYKHGRVRLPGRRDSRGRAVTQNLVSELTTWPNGKTDDLVMAHWFLEWQLPHIFTPNVVAPRRSTPSWLKAVS